MINIKDKEQRTMEYVIDQNLRQLNFIIGVLKSTIRKQFILSNLDFENALYSAEYDFSKQKKFIRKNLELINSRKSAVSSAQKEIFRNYVKEYLEKYDNLRIILSSIYMVPEKYLHTLEKLYNLIPDKQKMLWYKKLDITFSD